MTVILEDEKQLFLLIYIFYNVCYQSSKTGENVVFQTIFVWHTKSILFLLMFHEYYNVCYQSSKMGQNVMFQTIFV